MAKKGFDANLERLTLENTDYRRVLYTGAHSQLVLMCLWPSEEIGAETHEDRDQFFRFEEGEGTVLIDGVAHKISDGSAVIVPAGALHNVSNTGKAGPLRFYTVYSPPEHKDGTVRKTKAQAAREEEHYDGRPTE